MTAVVKTEKKKNIRNGQSRSSTAFLITLNQIEYFDEIQEYLLSLKNLSYAIAGKELAPTTGHPHIHIFCQFSKSCRLSIQKLMGAHIDKCMGTPLQNKVYVEKGGDIIWEEGEFKRRGYYTLKEIKQMPLEERENLPFIYYKMIKELNSDSANNMYVNETRKQIKVYYISGRSGIGKTRFAHLLIGKEAYNPVKYENGFWMGVTGSTRIALYDDWRDTHMRPSEFLNFVDYNKHVLNIKGGYKINQYTLIIITTIFRLEDIYKDLQDECRIQWTRRVKEIYLCEYKNKERENQINLLFNKIIYYFNLYIFKKIKNIK